MNRIASSKTKIAFAGAFLALVFLPLAACSTDEQDARNMSAADKRPQGSDATAAKAGSDSANTTSGTTAATPAGEATPAAPTPASAAPAGPPLSPAVKADLGKALDAYEILHEKLATDSTDGLAEAAGTLSSSARAASAAAPDALKARLGSLAGTADTLKTSSTDVTKAREAFAEVSRNVVALLSQEPSLTQGRYVFECPMTNGYKTWVQTASAITNPYMGSRMLECGAASEWKE